MGMGGSSVGQPAIRRSALVDEVTREFAVTRGAEVPRDVNDYILQHVLKSDAEWAAGQDSPQFDAAAIRQALTESLERAWDLGRDEGLATPTMPLVERAFVEVVDGKFHCPYLFHLC